MSKVPKLPKDQAFLEGGDTQFESESSVARTRWPMLIGLLVLVGAAFFLWRGLLTTTTPSTEVSVHQSISDQPLRLSFHSWIGNGLYFVTKEKGFFEQEGLNVDMQQVDDIAISKQLLSSGQVDGIMGWTPETIQVLANSGVKVKVVLATDVSDGADGVIAKSEIKTLADLKGKTVAFESSSPSHFFLSYLLDKEGMTTKDLLSVNQTAADAGASFVAGKVDAAVTWEPWLSKASEREGGKILISTKDLPILPALPAFSADVVAERPEVIKAYMRAVFATIDYIKANPDESYAIIAQGFNLTVEDVQAQIPTFHWLTYADNRAYFANPQDPNSVYQIVDKAGDLWVKQGLIQIKANLTDTIDGSLLENLYK